MYTHNIILFILYIFIYFCTLSHTKTFFFPSFLCLVLLLSILLIFPPLWVSFSFPFFCFLSFLIVIRIKQSAKMFLPFLFLSHCLTLFLQQLSLRIHSEGPKKNILFPYVCVCVYFYNIIFSSMHFPISMMWK